MNYNELFDTFTSRKGSGNSKWEDESVTMPMHVADMDFDTPKEICEAIIERAKTGIFGYQNYTDEYYDAVIGWFKRRHNVEMTKDMFIISPGIVVALAMSVLAFTKEGDGVIVQPPVYGPFYSCVEGNNRKVVKNNLIETADGYKIDFEDFEEKAKEAKLFLLCSPHNPIGRVWTEEELTKLFEICKKYDVMIVSDEIHCDFVFDGKHHSMLNIAKGYKKLVVCTAPSKTFNMAGFSNSNIIVPDKEIKEALQNCYHQYHIGAMNPVSMVATIAAYDKCAYWVDAMCDYIKGNRDYALKRLEGKKLKALKIEGTYLLWIDCTAYSDDPASELMKYGIKANDGAWFGESGKGFIRFNLGCPRKRLEEVMDKLLEIFN